MAQGTGMSRRGAVARGLSRVARSGSLRLTAGIAGLGLLMLVSGGGAQAQQAVGINPKKDCQVVRTCNFARNGEPRGCLSSYTCRTCKLVPVRCTLAGRSRCEGFVCSWGG